MKLDDRILRDFKIGVFVGVRKSPAGLHTAFFINDKVAARPDLESLVQALQKVPSQVRKAFEELAQPAAKEKKRRRRKKDPK